MIRLRHEHNMTQAELASALGVSTNYVWMIEKGTKEPSKKLVRKLVLLESGDAPLFPAEDAAESCVHRLNNKTVLIKGPPEACAECAHRSTWKTAETEQLELLLQNFVKKKEWWAVKEITEELLNRNITAKLKGQTDET